MSKTTSIALRLDTNLKEQASAIVEALGMDLTTAIRLFLTQLVFRKGIPFPIALGEKESVPNDEPIKAFKRTRNYIRSVKRIGLIKAKAKRRNKA